MYCREKLLPFDSMNEECGVFGIYSPEIRSVAYSVYYGLYALQHRGQESAGIAVTCNNEIQYYKDLGLVPEVFANGKLELLPEGDIAIGHVRYSTTDENSAMNSQPLVFTSKIGKMAVAFNGNIINVDELRKELIQEGVLFQTSICTEVIAALINKYTKNDIVEGVKEAVKYLKGSFAIVIMTTTKLIGVRDKNAICPMVLGRADDDYVLSSETCGLDAIDATYVKDLAAGEILVIDSKGTKSYFMEGAKAHSCIFEYVYFARPDSVIDGCSVYESRKMAGKLLAQKFPVKADVVAGVPDSAIASARGYAEESGIPYNEVLNKNRYVGRTFIQPEQSMRENAVRIKMNVLKNNVKGKVVVLLDDSIVRGTTSKKIVKMIRDAGAKEIHLRISSPIVMHPCYFGIDIKTYSQLIGAKMTKKEICEYIGADSLEFLSIEDLVKTAESANREFCLGCFNGEYPMEIDHKDVNK